MLVLPECSICFEDFDERVKPQTICCGHIFCTSCLDALFPSSSRCPICRVGFRQQQIRPIIGLLTLTDRESVNTDPNSDEGLLWVSLKNVISAQADPEFRRLLVLDHPAEALREARMSERIQIAADSLRLLVRIECENTLLRESLRVVEASEKRLFMRNRGLEVKLRRVGSQPAQAPPSPPQPNPDDISLSNTPRLTSHDSKSIFHSQAQGSPSIQPERPTRAPKAQSYQDSRLRRDYQGGVPSECSTTGTARENHLRSHSTGKNPECDAQGNPIRHPKIAVVIRSYIAEEDNELSLNIGEWLDLFPDTDLDPRCEWIWCGKGDGTVGYAPRRCLFVRSIVET